MERKSMPIKELFISVSIIFIIHVDAVMASPKEVDILIENSIKRFQRVSDYTCVLEKKVNKGGVVFHDPEIYVKYRKPTQYYFKWKNGRFQGQEIIYAEGNNNNRIVAHSGGLFRFITFHLDPEGSIAMKRNHHSLRRSGMEKVIDILKESCRRHKKTGYGKIELKEESRIDDRAVWVVQGDFPEDMGFYASRITIFLSKEYTLPLKVIVYDWSGKLFEEYTFHNLKLNVGLDEKDFDPESSEYNFN